MANISERIANRVCSPAAPSAADEEPPPPRVTRTVFQRRSPEEQALRRATITEISRQANEPRGPVNEDGRPPWQCGGSASPRTGHIESQQAPGGLGASMRRPPAQTADGPLRFSSAFESGNLLLAKLVCPPPCKGGGSSSSSAGQKDQAESPSELEYELYVDSDTQSSAGHTQWFYFGVSTQDFQGTVHFRIVNMRKKRSLYQNGLQPHVYSVRRNRGWEACMCHNMSYVPNAGNSRARGSTDGGRPDQHTLSFSYRIEHPQDEVYFAAFPPYTYSMLSGFLTRMERHQVARMHFRCSELCRSIGQLPVPLLVISEDIGRDARRESRDGRGHLSKQEPRLSVAVIARQHPGEVVGSWMAQGLIKFLLGPTPAAKRLRETYVFHVVPMVNVDGVVHGNSRCTLAGVDPNRVWNDPNPIIHPVIYALKNHLRNMANGACTVAGGACKGLDLFLDLHGHSAKFGCFFYGSCPTAPISNALFPKLCSVASQDVSFEQCHWRCTRSHRKTARYVMFKQLGVKYSYTLECSFFGPCCIASEASTEGSELVSRSCFTPGRVEWIGTAVARAAATFLGVDSDCHSEWSGYTEPANPSEDDPADEAVPASATASTATGDSSATEEVTWLDQKPPHSEVEIAKLQQEKERLDPPRNTAGGRLVHGMNCTCLETDLLPDLSCPKVLARRPWMTIKMLESTTVAEVLDGLIAVYGDHVPDLGRNVRGDGSDDGGDSDGDEGPEPEFPESDAAGAGPNPAKEAAGKEVAASASSSVPAGGRSKEASGSHQRPPRKPPGREASQSFNRGGTQRQVSQNSGVSAGDRGAGGSSGSREAAQGISSRSGGDGNVERSAMNHRGPVAQSAHPGGSDNAGSKSERGSMSAGSQAGAPAGSRRESPSFGASGASRRARTGQRASMSAQATDRAPSVENRSGSPTDMYCAAPQPAATQRLSSAPPWTNWKLEKASTSGPHSGRTSAHLWMDDSTQPDRTLSIGPSTNTSGSPSGVAACRPSSRAGSAGSGRGGAATATSGSSSPVQNTHALLAAQCKEKAAPAPPPEQCCGASPNRRQTLGPSSTPPPAGANASQARASGSKGRAPSVDGAISSLARATAQGNISPPPSQAQGTELSFAPRAQQLSVNVQAGQRGPSPTQRTLGGNGDPHACSAGAVADNGSHVSSAWQQRGPTPSVGRGNARHQAVSDVSQSLPRSGRDGPRGRPDSKLYNNGSSTERGERPSRNAQALLDPRLRASPTFPLDADDRPLQATELIQTRPLVSSRKGVSGIDQGLSIGGGIMPFNVGRGEQYPSSVKSLETGPATKRSQDRHGRREHPQSPGALAGAPAGSDGRKFFRRMISN